MSNDEIRTRIAAQGFLPFIYSLAIDELYESQDEMITAVVAAISTRDLLLEERDKEFLETLEPSTFFSAQPFLSKLIPHLEAPTRQVMEFAAALVTKGGEDLAANSPNAAFREWCAVDRRRSDAVITAAGDGDSLALDLLTFALEAKRNVPEAIAIVREGLPVARQRAAVALSRMDIGSDLLEPVLNALLALAAEAEDDSAAANSLLAAFDVAAKAADLPRDGLCDRLRSATEGGNAMAVHLAALVLSRHHSSLTEREIEVCLTAIEKLDPANAGTLKEIDWGLMRLWDSGRTEAAGRAVAAIISAAEGQIGPDELNGFFHRVRSGNPSNLAKLATSWLLEGDFHVCNSLSHLLSEIGKAEPLLTVEPSDLPASAVEQLFVCRKAVGFLVLSPMTAAAWPIAVLRAGNPSLREEVAELLFSPLLLSFGGAFRAHLERLLAAGGAEAEVVRDVLKRGEDVRSGFSGAEALVELHPGEAQREIQRVRWDQEREEIMEKARERSVLAKFVTTQWLLYGKGSSTYVEGPDGDTRKMEIPMASFSMRMELPMLDIFDPTGLDMAIRQMKLERRIQA